MIKLTNRLKMVANLAESREKVVDIGTDHAYLPVYLLQNKIFKTALACDINEGPLKNAQETINKYELSDKIITRLSDGLKEVNKNEADAVIIAGMGGILISEILSSAEWLKNSDKQLVLQPMTHLYDVRKYLCENGFEILKEQTAKEGKRNYIAISARYSGKSNLRPEWYYYAGDLIYGNNQNDIDFCNKTIATLNKKYAALKATTEFKEAEYLKNILEEIENEKRKRNI